MFNLFYCVYKYIIFLGNNQIYLIYLLFINSKLNVVVDKGNVSLLNGYLYGLVIRYPLPYKDFYIVQYHQLGF